MIVVKVGGSLYDHPQLAPRLRAYLDSLAPAEVMLVPGGGEVVDAVRKLDRVHGLGEEVSHGLAVLALGVTGEWLGQILARESSRTAHPFSHPRGEELLAPTGPRSIAQGVSPGSVAPVISSPEGATHAGGCVAPSGLRIHTAPATQTSRSDAPLGRRQYPGPPATRRGGEVRVLDCLAFAQDDESRPGKLPHSWDVTSDSIAARAAVVYGAERLVLLKSVDVPPGTPWEEAAARGWVDPHFPTVVAGAAFAVEVVNFRHVLDSLVHAELLDDERGRVGG
ncbi:MAG TPA: hypothetical protein VM529_00565 [Gemmata sp.]|nr:hypothetical protein [Gemmata sp.]